MQSNSSSTRDEILYMLKTQKKLTVTVMAKQLGITEMAVRRHLNTLERDQYIESTLVRQAIGRPINVYKLTILGEDLFPRDYKKMALGFLKDIKEIAGTGLIDQLFENRQGRLRQQYQKRLENKSFDEKIAELAKLQNENGYMVEYEKKNDGSYFFKEYNCPISEVAKDYHKACNCELELFRDVLGTEKVVSRGCMAHGDDSCDYEITRPD
jgi:DeoR family suf operon transcriptional repressor